MTGRGYSRPLLGHGHPVSWLPYELPAGDDRQVSSQDRRSVKLRVRPPPAGTHQCHRATSAGSGMMLTVKLTKSSSIDPQDTGLRAGREPAMLGIKNGHRPQLDCEHDSPAYRGRSAARRVPVGDGLTHKLTDLRSWLLNCRSSSVGD